MEESWYRLKGFTVDGMPDDCVKEELVDKVFGKHRMAVNRLSKCSIKVNIM